MSSGSSVGWSSVAGAGGSAANSWVSNGDDSVCGFYWTEGTRGLGWAVEPQGDLTIRCHDGAQEERRLALGHLLHALVPGEVGG